MPKQSLTCHDACDMLEEVLSGGTRGEIVDELSRTGDFADALRRLRAAMASHAFRTSGHTFDFAKVVRKLDKRTRQDGFRVFHSWDHKAHRFTANIVPVLMLDFYESAEVTEPSERLTLLMLLDFYFLHVLALCAMRAWDDGHADETLDRVTRLTTELQGSSGSGHRFLDDAETLLIYALSQFHPEEQAYDRLIAKIVTLTEEHQTTFALSSAAVLSSHLRWGFWLMYGRDVVRMRNDNVGDYPWLLNSVVTLMRAYARMLDEGRGEEARADVVEGLLQGFAADPWAFIGKAPPALAEYASEYDELLALLARRGHDLLRDFEGRRPSKEAYAPLSLHFNFPHNTLVAILTLALLEGKPQTLPLNALFGREMERGPDDETQEGLARTLMAFSSGSPDRLGAHGAILVAYDPLSGIRSFSMTSDAIRESLRGP